MADDALPGFYEKRMVPESGHIPLYINMSDWIENKKNSQGCSNKGAFTPSLKQLRLFGIS